MSVWSDLMEAKPASVNLTLEDGERYLGMDVQYFKDDPSSVDVSCESWSGMILKNDGEELKLLTLSVREGLRSLEGTSVPVMVEWDD